MAALLEVKDLQKYFKVPAGFLHAVDGITFSLEAGKSFTADQSITIERGR
mgnify:CR=1 FL=1